MQIELKNITKRYSRKTALNSVSVAFSDCKIHALVGENGAGKSTLASILAGAIAPSEGQIFIDGQEVSFADCAAALARGIVMVAQRPLLADSLSARENIYLALTSQKNYSVTKLLLSAKVPPLLTELKDQWCPDLNLEAKVRDLGGNHRFYVSLLASLMLQPSCLILDEPSVFLDSQQRQTLYQRLETAAKGGMNIIVITHSSSEAQKYCQTVTFLKDGCVADIAGYWSAAVEEQMVETGEFVSEDAGANRDAGAGGAAGEGGALSGALAATSPAPSATIRHKSDSSLPCLTFEHISARPRNRAVIIDASLSVSYGEITAVSGMKEAALDTLEDLLSGMLTDGLSGSISFYSKKGEKTTLNLQEGGFTARFLRKHKSAIVPSDRVYRASHPRLTISELLSVYDDKVSPSKIDQLIETSKVNITKNDTASSLSGGMLQRLILVRELSTEPDFVILCNPLQGLDIKAQKTMTGRIFSLAKEGKAVLIIGAADFPLSLCHKVYAMESGICKLSYEGGLL